MGERFSESATFSMITIGHNIHHKRTALSYIYQKQFLLTFLTTRLIAERGKETEWSKETERSKRGQLPMKTVLLFGQ